MSTPVFYTVLTRERSYFVDGYAVADLRSAILGGKDEVDVTVQPNLKGSAPETIRLKTEGVVAVIRHDGLLQGHQAARVAEVIPIDRYRMVETI